MNLIKEKLVQNMFIHQPMYFKRVNNYLGKTLFNFADIIFFLIDFNYILLI